MSFQEDVSKACEDDLDLVNRLHQTIKYLNVALEQQRTALKMANEWKTRMLKVLKDVGLEDLIESAYIKESAGSDKGEVGS